MHDAETLICGVHGIVSVTKARVSGVDRDKTKPARTRSRAAPDQFHFFMRLGPSERVAFVPSDMELVHKVISVNKARVSGDRDTTKASEVRGVRLCP